MPNEEEIKELVIARIESTPKNVGVSFGGSEKMTKEELVNHVRQGDEIGKKVIEIQMKFLQSLKEGVLYEQ